MALYVPAARRRRRIVVFTVGALVVGLLLGALLGRVTAPTVDDRLASVRSSAQQTAAGLRVIAIHDQSNTVSNQSANSGADLVLKRTRSELERNSATRRGSRSPSARRC